MTTPEPLELELVPMSFELMLALFERRTHDAERMLHARLSSEDLYGGKLWLQLRMEQVSEDASWIPWLLRAVIRTRDRQVLGHVGFHGPPGSHPLEREWPGVVELGYAIASDQRGRGYATRATAQLLEWARTKGVSRVLASIAPHNTASLRVAAKLGFELARSYEHEDRGVEQLLLRQLSPVTHDPDAQRTDAEYGAGCDRTSGSRGKKIQWR